MKYLLYGVSQIHCIGFPPRMLLALVLGWIVQHSGAEAHATIVAHQDVVVAATLTTLPKLVIFGEFRESYGYVSQS